MALLSVQRAKRPRDADSFVVSVVGASRSGKTSLTRRLPTLFKKLDKVVEVVSQDTFRSRAEIPYVQGKLSWEGPERTDWAAFEAKIVEASQKADLVIVEGYLLYHAPSTLQDRFCLCLVCDTTIELCRQCRSSFPTADKLGARGWDTVEDYVDNCMWPCHMSHDKLIPHTAIHLPIDEDLDTRAKTAYEVLEALFEA